MAILFNRRSFLWRSSALAAAAQVEAIRRVAWAADPEYAIADTASGKVRGAVVEGVRVFKGIPYGDTTAGRNRFMPPVAPPKWAGVRDALAYGHTAPQGGGTARAGTPEQGEDCLVLNVSTPALAGKRPVMVWLHGGGFASGSGSSPGYDGVNLARNHDVVLVSINHRLNVFGQTYLGEVAGSEF